jgi:hypothetical protein
MDVVVEGWFHETLDGPRCEFACIQHNHFGFALPRQDVKELAEKLADLLNRGECQSESDSVLHVDWSEGVEGWVMIAFRPAHDCQGRFYDISKDAAVVLLRKLRRLLED